MNEFYIAIIGLIGVLIGAGISAFVTWKVAKQTQKEELKKQEIELLYFKLKELSLFLNQILEIGIRRSSQTDKVYSAIYLAENNANLLSDVEVLEFNKQLDIFQDEGGLDKGQILIEFTIDLIKKKKKSIEKELRYKLDFEV